VIVLKAIGVVRHHLPVATLLAEDSASADSAASALRRPWSCHWCVRYRPAGPSRPFPQSGGHRQRRFPKNHGGLPGELLNHGCAAGRGDTGGTQMPDIVRLRPDHCEGRGIPGQQPVAGCIASFGSFLEGGGHEASNSQGLRFQRCSESIRTAIQPVPGRRQVPLPGPGRDEPGPAPAPLCGDQASLGWAITRSISPYSTASAALRK
jgi:hypothetical protein